MNQTTKIILAGAGFILLLLGLVAGFNYYVDPMCYYRCPTVDVTKKTQNVYYRGLQTAVFNPDAEILILGSSRGEVLPPQWVTHVTGMKAINLSLAGGEALLKIAVINTALDAGVKVKKVIWLADYHELSEDSTEVKTRITPTLRKYVGHLSGESSVRYVLDHLQRLINHYSFEASIELLRDPSSSAFKPLGNGSELDYRQCLEPNYARVAESELKKTVHSTYGEFAPRMRAPFNEKYMKAFEDQIRQLDQKGIDVLILIPPLHPIFMEKLEADSPQFQNYKKEWLRRIKNLASPRVRIVDYFDSGIPGDDQGPRYWNDGVHLTCKSMIQLLQEALMR